MARLKGFRYHSWRLAGVSISAMLVAIIVAGLVALAVNERVWDLVAETIQHDMDLEDRVDELWVAVIDLRYYHSNLALGGPSAKRIEHFESAYQRLLTQISRLEQLQLDAPALPQPQELRELGRRYYADFQPAIPLHATNWVAFEEASDQALALLTELESRVRRIEQFSERHTGADLADVEMAAQNARLILIGKLIAHLLIGGGLAYLIIQILREQHQAGLALQRTLQHKSDFIADISHELRTPLTVLRTNAEVALILEDSCAHTDLLAEIARESAHMSQLVDDLLLLARSEAGALALEREAVSLPLLHNELAERANALVSQQALALQLDLAAEGLAEIDQRRIVQAVLILVDNAAKYSVPGSTITLRTALRRGELVIEVADQGLGIPAAELPFIFERFYRSAKARTRKPGGAGLGLAIAKGIVTAHGGRVAAESVLNQGTQICFFLPLTPPPVALPSAMPFPILPHVPQTTP